ncbi:MAG TPA: phosphatase PAP2 family protein [Polyangiaceae bacterium]|nr:phosphatase PAP2 family protein [Polyangiaceae bacterium]
MARAWRHLRSLWPGASILVPMPFVAHAVWAAFTGRFRWENAVILALVLSLFAIGPRTKRLLVGIYPLGLVGLLYSTMKLVQNFGLSSESVHLCDQRAVEAAIFGVTVNGTRGTYHDWLQAHANRSLDLLCAFPYAAFLWVCFGCAFWLYVWDYARMTRFAWCFLALNVAGFVTYHLYPAAPPWYYHAHGCVVDVHAHASEGPNLARVDAMLGVSYFAGMYGRSSDVFGAMPSLHVAYALIVAVEGWATFGPVLRASSVLFFLLMCFAAVYLDHHWVLDVIAGVVYCLAVVAACRWVTRRPTQGEISSATASETARAG